MELSYVLSGRLLQCPDFVVVQTLYDDLGRTDIQYAVGMARIVRQREIAIQFYLHRGSAISEREHGESPMFSSRNSFDQRYRLASADMAELHDRCVYRIPVFIINLSTLNINDAVLQSFELITDADTIVGAIGVAQCRFLAVHLFQCDWEKRFLNLQNRDFGSQSARGILIKFGIGRCPAGRRGSWLPQYIRIRDRRIWRRRRRGSRRKSGRRRRSRNNGWSLGWLGCGATVQRVSYLTKTFGHRGRLGGRSALVGERRVSAGQQ